MARYGYTLLSELHDPRELVDAAEKAEDAGFDFAVISDHFHPWLESHGHSPFAWSVLGAVADRTTSIDLATMVTCPFVRYHPAIVAQAAATIGVMSGGRFTLGLGAGERLNEHIVGEGWPPADQRHEMLDEAIGMITELWNGGYVTVRGEHLTVEDARIFDRPSTPPAIFVAASGAESVALALKHGAGLCATEPDADLVKRYLDGGGRPDAVWGQQALSWDDDEERALKLAHERFRFGIQGWKVQAELPNVVNFEASTQHIAPEEVAKSVICGASAERVAHELEAWTEAGFANVAVVQVADDQDGFFHAWRTDIRRQLDA
jgi:G6PDH family F420-dependent oxidoreductase